MAKKASAAKKSKPAGPPPKKPFSGAALPFKKGGGRHSNFKGGKK